jgi:hypothetical protein
LKYASDALRRNRVLIRELTDPVAAGNFDQFYPLENHQRLVGDGVERQALLIRDGLGNDLVVEINELERQVGNMRQIKAGLLDRIWLSRDNRSGS